MQKQLCILLKSQLLDLPTRQMNWLHYVYQTQILGQCLFLSKIFSPIKVFVHAEGQDIQGDFALLLNFISTLLPTNQTSILVALCQTRNKFQFPRRKIFLSKMLFSLQRFCLCRRIGHKDNFAFLSNFIATRLSTCQTNKLVALCLTGNKFQVNVLSPHPYRSYNTLEFRIILQHSQNCLVKVI